jgi:hypothetical protein
MKKMLGIVMMWVLVLAAVCFGQSLGDAARAIRSQKAMAAKAKSERVYNNENLPRGTSISVIGGVAPAAPGAKGSAPAAAVAASGAAAAGGASKEAEQAWKSKFAKLRETVSTEERRLDVLQRELNLAQMQAYSDPNVANREAFTRGELNTRTAEIDKQKANVETAKKAIADLEEELRKANLPSGWAQP